MNEGPAPDFASATSAVLPAKLKSTFSICVAASSVGGWDRQLADLKPPNRRLPTQAGEPEAALARTTGKQALQALLLKYNWASLPKFVLAQADCQQGIVVERVHGPVLRPVSAGESSCLQLCHMISKNTMLASEDGSGYDSVE